MAKNRVVKFGVQPNLKMAKNIEDPNSFNSKTPVWRFSDLDFDYKWGWNYLGSLVRFELDSNIESIINESNDDVLMDAFVNMSDKYYTYDKLLYHLNRNTKSNLSISTLTAMISSLDKGYFKSKIIDKLSQFENSTWESIKKETFGKKNKSKHHFQQVNDKFHPEAKKRLLDLNKDDSQLFTLRLEGSIRIWGILDRGVFNLLWFDPYHEIYQSNSNDNNSKIIK